MLIYDIINNINKAIAKKAYRSREEYLYVIATISKEHLDKM